MDGGTTLKQSGTRATSQRRTELDDDMSVTRDKR